MERAKQGLDGSAAPNLWPGECIVANALGFLSIQEKNRTPRAWRYLYSQDPLPVQEGGKEQNLRGNFLQPLLHHRRPRLRSPIFSRKGNGKPTGATRSFHLGITPMAVEPCVKIGGDQSRSKLSSGQRVH